MGGYKVHGCVWEFDPYGRGHCTCGVGKGLFEQVCKLGVIAVVIGHPVHAVEHHSTGLHAFQEAHP